MEKTNDPNIKIGIYSNVESDTWNIQRVIQLSIDVRIMDGVLFPVYQHYLCGCVVLCLNVRWSRSLNVDYKLE